MTMNVSVNRPKSRNSSTTTTAEVAGTKARSLAVARSGASLVAPLEAMPGDVSVDKHRGGVNVDQCVTTTLQDANFLGYDCILPPDCGGATSPACRLDPTLDNVRQCFGFVAKGGPSSTRSETPHDRQVRRGPPRLPHLAGDTNRMALLWNPPAEAARFVMVIEVFDEGGRTPPDSHAARP